MEGQGESLFRHETDFPLTMTSFKSGFISILGRPNVGKSTLFNRFVGEKVAITSPKPQTTRNRILGVKNVKGGQLIFLDTPGIHEGRSPLNQRMVETAVSAGRDADVLLFLIEASSRAGKEEEQMIDSFRESHGVFLLVINKIDRMRKEMLLPVIDRFRKIHSFEAIVPVSAKTGEGVDILLDEILKYLPESPPYYPEEVMTDQSERFLVSEIIREKVIQHAYQEIPYATAVTVESFKEHPERNLVVIQANIHAEKNTHKKILIGKGGQKLRIIGETARVEIESLLGKKVYLELWVAVEKNWTQDPRALNRFGY
jgi:GTPase